MCVYYLCAILITAYLDPPGDPSPWRFSSARARILLCPRLARPTRGTPTPARRRSDSTPRGSVGSDDPGTARRRRVRACPASLCFQSPPRNGEEEPPRTPAGLLPIAPVERRGGVAPWIWPATHPPPAIHLRSSGG
jgi:hypothetical protein